MKRTLTLVLATTLALALLVSCSPKEPDTSTPDTSKPSVSEPGISVPDVSVDLAAFYETLVADFEMPMGISPIEGEMIEGFYAGFTAIDTVQSVIAVSEMGMSSAEYAMAEVADEADIDAVKAIFQARIDAQVNGGAFYPEPTEIWTNDAQIIVNGNFVMMVVDSLNGDAIVESFNGLFA